MLVRFDFEVALLGFILWLTCMSFMIIAWTLQVRKIREITFDFFFEEWVMFFIPGITWLMILLVVWVLK